VAGEGLGVVAARLDQAFVVDGLELLTMSYLYDASGARVVKRSAGANYFQYAANAPYIAIDPDGL
jgi:hypothetical protein